MTNIFMVITKYISILLMGIYVIISYFALRRTTKTQKHICYVTQNIILYIFHILSFIVIYLNNMSDKIIILGFLQLLYFMVTILVYKSVYPKVNKMLLNNMMFLISIGFVLLTRLSFERAVKQFVFCVVATIIAMFLPWIFGRTKSLRKYYYLYGALGLFFLLVVCVIGKSTYGAQISLTLGPVTLQPSEFVKITFVLFISGILYKDRSFKTVVISAVLGAAHVLILVLSTDLGSALIYFVAYIFVIYVTTGKSFYLFAGFGAAGAASVIAYRLFSHVQVRVAAWQDPWSIIDGKGYQITQSLFGIGTGGWFGMGLCKGEPGYIPVVDQDFVFSAICEELGGFFGLFLILLYLNLFIVFVRTAFRCVDEFYKTIVFGFSVVMGFQVFLTVGGAIKLIPSTGVTLPFISYGGSSIVSTILIFAIVQGIYINEGRDGGMMDEQQ